MTLRNNAPQKPAAPAVEWCSAKLFVRALCARLKPNVLLVAGLSLFVPAAASAQLQPNSSNSSPLQIAQVQPTGGGPGKPVKSYVGFPMLDQSADSLDRQFQDFTKSQELLAHPPSTPGGPGPVVPRREINSKK